uniref:Wadjet anti-phage system protein JetD domain-containing protein n=1 Tax=Olsenella timonensis TaxID=1805478 RepID=UPI000AD59286|nr:Wadjet anti-phage system protein JetD domain-containing protein [Olsenella timonensis]
MAHRLTEQEHDTVLTLAKTLGRQLPSQFRSVAGGIASGLVRSRKSPLPAADVASVLEKYGADETALRALLDAGVLEPAEGGYLLHAPRDEEAPAEKGERSIARTETPRPPARRGGRGLAGLDTIRKQTPELNDVRRQIIGLDPRLWINGWLLSTPDAFLRYERELRALDAALAGGATLGDGTLSLRELSYQLFGDEKFLAVEADGRKLLHLMGITDVVNSRPQMRLELLHHIPKRHRHMRLVVSENLDPWVNMRNAMFIDGRKKILGERVHGVVFGNGYLVDDPHKLPDLLDTLHADDVRILYWGDIDRAGLSILSKLSDMADGRFSVEPFAPAYRKMVRRAMRRFPDPLMNEETDQGGVRLDGIELMEGALDKDEMAYLRAVVEDARLIPQEILTAHDL